MDRLAKMILIREWLLEQADELRGEIYELTLAQSKYQVGKLVEYKIDPEDDSSLTGKIVSRNIVDNSINLEVRYQVKNIHLKFVSTAVGIRKSFSFDEVTESQILRVIP